MIKTYKLFESTVKSKSYSEGLSRELYLLSHDEGKVNNLNTAKYLIKNGADVNYNKNFNNSTSLMAAANINNFDILKLLIDLGANLDMQNDDGYTALIYASFQANLDCINLLVKAGANLDIQDNDGKTALMHASAVSYEPIIKFLIKSGANMLLKDKEGNTFINEDSGDPYDSDDHKHCLTNYGLQKLILTKEPSLYKEFIKNDVKIHPKIKQELKHIVSGGDLNLI